ncbi:hypothetical protein Tco_0364994 [Tanacetum coccineum]
MPVDEVCSKFAEFFEDNAEISKDKESVEKVLGATKLPEDGNSHSAYSPYHLEGKLNFGVGNVTPWAADVGRRKIMTCYVQGSGRRKRKKVDEGVVGGVSVGFGFSKLNRLAAEPFVLRVGVFSDVGVFSGDDVRGWLFRCEQLILIDQVDDIDKFIKIHEGFVDWVVYKQAILKRFGNVYEDPMSGLKNLKYETTARACEDAFDTLLSRVEINAYCLTNLQEATLNAVKKKNKPVFGTNNTRQWNGHKCSGQLYSLVVLPEEELCEILEEDEDLFQVGIVELQAP